MAILVQYSQIPAFLKDGAFYRALSDDPTSEIEIPEHCFYVSERVETLHDFRKLLNTTTFWGLTFIPVGLIDYCYNNDFILWRKVVDEMLELDYAKDLLFVFGVRFHDCPVYNAVQIGRTEIVEYLAPHCRLTGNAMKAAARFGRIDYVQLLREHGHPWDESVCEAAAWDGRLDSLKYLIDSGCPYDDKVLVAALFGEHRNCIEFLLNKGVTMPASIADFFARTGDIELLQFAVRNDCILHADATMAAAEYDHFLCLEYLLENGCPTNTSACVAACRNGHLNCLEVLHAHDVPWNADCTCMAAEYGRLDLLQFLNTNGCPWDASAPKAATEHGHLHCLQYLLENGCPYEASTVHIAVEDFEGQILCLRYLVEEHGAYFDVDGSIFMRAFASGNCNAVQYLLDQGCPYQNCTNFAQQVFKFFVRINVARADYDQNLKRCLQIAHHYGWDMLQSNTVVTNDLQRLGENLPLSLTYLIVEGIDFKPNEVITKLPQPLLPRELINDVVCFVST